VYTQEPGGTIQRTGASKDRKSRRKKKKGGVEIPKKKGKKRGKVREKAKGSPLTVG